MKKNEKNEKNDIKFQGIIDNDFSEYASGGLHHPQENFGITQFMKWGNDEETSRQAWAELMKGVNCQKELNASVGKIIENLNNVNDLFWEKYCPDAEYREICMDIYKTLDDTNATDKEKQQYISSVIRSSNTHYTAFAEILGEYLAVESGRELALWSGGYDLSEQSYKWGKCPLEHTILGRFLDTTPIVNEWALEAPLWNIISRKFVKVYNDKSTNEQLQAHVYIRTIDHQSVLLRQEVPMLKNVHVHWHIFYYNGNQEAEIGRGKNNEPIAINPGSNPNGFDQEPAFQLLCQKLSASQYATNKRVIATVLGPLSNNIC